jgi:hypothetical protein
MLKLSGFQKPPTLCDENSLAAAELRYNNGHVERLAFYFYPDSNDAIGMGNKAFT